MKDKKILSVVVIGMIVILGLVYFIRQNKIKSDIDAAIVDRPEVVEGQGKEGTSEQSVQTQTGSEKTSDEKDEQKRKEKEQKNKRDCYIWRRRFIQNVASEDVAMEVDRDRGWLDTRYSRLNAKFNKAIKQWWNSHAS